MVENSKIAGMTALLWYAWFTACIHFTFSKSYFQLILINNFEQKIYTTRSGGATCKLFVFSIYPNIIFMMIWCVHAYFGFPIVNSTWLSGNVPRLPSYGVYISQLVRFAWRCTCVFDFHSKNLRITSKLLTQGYRYHKLRKTYGKSFGSYSELLSKFDEISFQ